MKKRPDLLLLPGFMCDQTLWDLMLTDLSSIGCIHFGNMFEDVSIGSMANRILNDAPTDFFLVGFSMGGYVATRIAIKAPQRVKKLILLNTAATPTTQGEKIRNKRNKEIVESLPFRGLAIASLKRALHPANENDQFICEHMQKMSLSLGKETFLRQIGVVREDYTAELVKVKCPTLIITSDHDRLRSMQESSELVDKIPGAQMTIINDCGHMTPLEQPKKLSKIINNWISQNNPCVA